MSSKKTELTEKEKRLVVKAGIDPARCEVLQDYPKSMLVRDSKTKKSAVIFKA